MNKQLFVMKKAYDHGLNKGEYHSIEYALGNAYVKQGQIHYAKKRKK